MVIATKFPSYERHVCACTFFEDDRIMEFHLLTALDVITCGAVSSSHFEHEVELTGNPDG